MTPKLSIVATSRNDNHGGDMTKRMRIFVNGLIHQCNKFNLPVELIMVEWNPPANTPPLSEILPQPKTGDKLMLRYITVPAEVHNQYSFASTIPLFQMTAKNVGIRRAKAEFVLCTNIDLLFSDALMKTLSEIKLAAGNYYRCIRYDVKKDIDETQSVEEQLKWCTGNTIARHGIGAEYINVSGLGDWFYRIPFLPRILNYFIAPFRKLIQPFRFMISQIDYETCGDFTLMSKTDWEKIEGYVELDLYSIHIDSMALSAAVAQGIKQIVFPQKECTYHIDHADGWAAMNPLQMLHFSIKRPGVDWSIMHNAGTHIIKNKTNYGINKPDWGFAGKEFKETVFNPF